MQSEVDKGWTEKQVSRIQSVCKRNRYKTAVKPGRRAAPLTAQFVVLGSVFSEHILLKRKLHGGLELCDQIQSISRNSGRKLPTFGEGYEPTDSRSESNPM